MSKYPNFKIFQENDFDFDKLKISEIGEKNDLKLLDEWLESKTYNNARSEELVSYIDEGDPVVIYPLGTNRKENHKEFHKIKKCKQDSHLLDEILKPQIERVIFLKFAAEVLSEIKLMSKEKKVTEIINSSFNQTVNSIKSFAFNDDYRFCLDCDPYFSENVIWRDIVIKECMRFFEWKFSDYHGPENENEEKLFKFFNKNFEKISKDKFFKRRKTFRYRAMKRMDRIRNEIRKLSNLHDTSHYAYSNKEIEEICDTLCGSVNNLLESFTSRNNDFNPVVRKHIDVKPQLDNPKGSDLEVELKSYKGRTNWENELKNLKEAMEKKFTELELKISSSKEEEND